MPLLNESATSGPVFVFLVVFAVILLGPIVVSRFGLPGLIGLVLGGYVIGAHGLGLIPAGDQTVPELGQLGLLYLMFVAGLELDLQILRENRRAAIGLGLLAFVVPGGLGVCIGLGLGWSHGATLLLGALLASHTLIVYPTLREAGLSDTRPVASAVGATVLTDTLALITLAVVAGAETDPGAVPRVIAKIAIGFVVLGIFSIAVLPRLVEAVLRQWGADGVARYLVILVAMLGTSLLALAFGIEGIIGAFFAGLALNSLVPNEGPSMEQVEFFGTAVFVPIFLVSIGLLLDPSVMFTGDALSLAALICGAAFIGKAVACWVAGAWLGFSWPERLTMYVLTVPQAAATLAVTLIGFEIGLFGVTVVNAVLVLIVVSILLAAILTRRVVGWMPAPERGSGRLGARVLVVTPVTGPSDAAVRAAALLSRPDGGSSELVVTRAPGEPAPDSAELRGVRQRLARHGFEGTLRVEVADVSDAVRRAAAAGEHSVVIVDEPAFDHAPTGIPLLVVDGGLSGPSVELVHGGGSEIDEMVAEIQRRFARDAPRARTLRRGSGAMTGRLGSVTVRRRPVAAAAAGDGGAADG
ncbi:MAG TPA: cation:proton antiporter [Gaiellales bacterium]|jgi:Kef-type K+ transport system membrane component KefB|nr:cation:proton antiporter [Gaiellales bacterium]